MTAGILLCGASILRGVGQVDLAKIRKVVIFLPPTMGDCVNHLATLRWLRDGLPDREIVAVSSGLGLEVLRTWPIEGVEVWDRKRLWWKLVRGRFDLGLFPYVQNKMVRVARFARVRQLVGLRGGKHNGWFAAGVDRVKGEHQVLDVCRRLFGAVGLECGKAAWYLRKILDSDADPGIKVGVMTGASRSDKKWSATKFKEVAELFSDRECSVLNFGSPSEIGALGGVETFDFAEWQQGLFMTSQFLSSCNLFVTNDTGLMHLAGAVGTPVVGIFMVESPDEYYPPGTGHELLRGDVSVEEVLAAVERILGRQG